MVVSTDSSRTMPDWVKYGVFWHVYPLGFCGADIRPAGPRQFHGRGLDAIIPWLEYVRDLGASGLLLGPVFESARMDTTRSTICISMCDWAGMPRSISLSRPAGTWDCR